MEGAYECGSWFQTQPSAQLFIFHNQLSLLVVSYERTSIIKGEPRNSTRKTPSLKHSYGKETASPLQILNTTLPEYSRLISKKYMTLMRCST